MSFDEDPNDQANISGADLAILYDELTTLREKCAELQAKLDTAIDALDGANEGIARRQSQLDEAAKQEPYLFECIAPPGRDDLLDEEKLTIVDSISVADYRDDGYSIAPLYRHPPNLPALIEQAKRDEKNACAAAATAAKEHHDKYDIAAAIRARGAKK